MIASDNRLLILALMLALSIDSSAFASSVEYKLISFCVLPTKSLKGVNGKGLSFEPKEKGLKVVWSTDAEGYRMINLAQVTEITFDGKTTTYNQL